MPFSNLGLAPILTAPLARLGYKEPTPVQAAAIPIVMTGADLLARAQTGTGKTAAFGLPMIERLLVSRPRTRSFKPLGLVLVPTRELAQQVHRSLTTFGAAVQLRVTAIYGGVGMSPQVGQLRHGTDIIVATPGRLMDHMQRRTVDLSAVEIVTLDEADRMLDMGFLPALRRILPALPREHQTLLFSATFTDAIVQLSKAFTRDPKRVDVSNDEVVATTITHHVHPVAAERKRELLLHVLSQAPASQALVFCKTKRGADRVGDHLEDAGLKATVIHGNKAQGARTRSLADFKAGRVTVLVATDIAARGLDVAHLPLVVNYDMPMVPEDYVHRVGRTGRAGATGRAVSLATPADRDLLRDVQRLLAEPIEHVIVKGFEMSAAAMAAGAATPNPGRPSGQRRSEHPSSRRPKSPSRPFAQRRARYAS
jgi:ATP-dependent RNA helicase RhlE